MNVTHPHWKDLLIWLEKHGMDTTQKNLLVEARTSHVGGHGLFALKSLDSATPLFSIPASALLNISTLSHYYPQVRNKLTATQLISLHLFLHRPAGSQASSDPIFGPYISILPQDFNSHPLTWFCDKQHPGAHLLPTLPASVLYSLTKVAERFRADWEAVCQYLQVHPFVLFKSGNTQLSSFRSGDPIFEMGFLWAWLNVNTRCIYYRTEQSRSHPNNLTLCPILDFANHTIGALHMLPRSSSNAANTILPKINDDFTLLSPVGVTIKSGDELYLTYGLHANKTLFVEYGFVNEISWKVPLHGNVQGEVDVYRLVKPLFEARGGLGMWMKRVLKNEGYWGDWTLHLLPQPAHPSYRLITALRLYHLLSMSTEDLSLVSDGILQPWRDTLPGERDQVSEDNEKAWKDTLLGICRRLVEDAGSAKVDCEQRFGSCFTRAKESIRMLWEEEYFVAYAVLESIRANEEF